MVDRDPWRRLLSEPSDDRPGHCRRICELCVSRLDVTGAGLSITTARGGRGVVCATDDVAAEISASVGALTLHRVRVGDLRDGQLADALMAADAAALAFLRLDTTTGDAFADDPQARASYQFHVHQATGMVSVQIGVSLDGAFLMLRARAFATGRSLTDISSDVVTRRLRFSPEDE